MDATLVFPGTTGPDYTHDVAYIFSGDSYIKWDLKTDKQWWPPCPPPGWNGVRKIKDGFDDIPFDKIDATLIFPGTTGPDYTHDVAYIFSGDSYIKWDLKTDKQWWPPCPPEGWNGARKIKDGFPSALFEELQDAETTGGGCGDEVAYDPTPEKLTSNKNFEKKNKKVVKEGGKRGVEIEGAADMGGLQFFCTAVEEPAGDPDWLYESLKAMNAKSDPTEEERKGGSGHVGKMLVSIDETKCIALVSYVPQKHLGKIQADVWLKDILIGLGAPASSFISGNTTTAKALVNNDSDKGLFALKLKDSAIGQSIDYLKKKGLFPDNQDDDDDYVFGDDDFPS